MSKQRDSNDRIMRKKRILLLIKGYLLIILLACLPVISMLLSVGISDYLGCTVNEAGPSECMLWGKNIGEMLSIMFVAAWYFLLTFPLGCLLFLAWTVYWAMKYNKRNKII